MDTFERSHLHLHLGNLRNWDLANLGFGKPWDFLKKLNYFKSFLVIYIRHICMKVSQDIVYALRIVFEEKRKRIIINLFMFVVWVGICEKRIPKDMESKDVGNWEPIQQSGVFKCCSDWFILKH